ncbi:hypothetical protein JCM11641_004399 [Rhodosporidiobolus odoratus]
MAGSASTTRPSASAPSCTSRQPQQSRLAPLGATPLVTPKPSSSKPKAKSQQAKLNSSTFVRPTSTRSSTNPRHVLKEKEPNCHPTSTASFGSSSALSIAAQRKRRALQSGQVERPDTEDLEQHEPEPAIEPRLGLKPRRRGVLSSLFPRRSASTSTSTSTSSGPATATSSTTRPPSIARQILRLSPPPTVSPSSASTSTSTSMLNSNPRRSVQLAFSDSDSASDDESAERRKKRRKADKGGWGRLDLGEAEDEGTRMLMEELLGAEERRGGSEEGEHEEQSSPQEGEEEEGEPSTASTASADSELEAETLQAQLVPRSRIHPLTATAARGQDSRPSSTVSPPKKHSKAKELVPDTPEFGSGEEKAKGKGKEKGRMRDVLAAPTADDGTEEEGGEEHLERLAFRWQAGEADDSGFAEGGLDDPIVGQEASITAQLKVKRKDDSQQEAQRLPFLGDDEVTVTLPLSHHRPSILVLSSSSPPPRSAAITVTSSRRREADPNPPSSSPVRAKRPRPLRSSTSSSSASARPSSDDSPSTASGSGASSEGSNELGRTASALLMPPPPVPTRKRLRRGIRPSPPSEEEEQQGLEEGKPRSKPDIKGKGGKASRRSRVLVEDTQPSTLFSFSQPEPLPLPLQLPLPLPTDEPETICDETLPLPIPPLRTEDPLTLPLPIPFPSSSLPLPLPTPRPLAQPISSPERFYPTPLKKHLGLDKSISRSAPDSASPAPASRLRRERGLRGSGPSSSAPAMLVAEAEEEEEMELEEEEEEEEEPVGLVARAARQWAQGAQQRRRRFPSPPPPPHPRPEPEPESEPLTAVGLAPTRVTSSSIGVTQGSGPEGQGSAPQREEIVSAWLGAKPLTPPPPTLPRQTKLGEFFLPSASTTTTTTTTVHPEEEQVVEESQFADSDASGPHYAGRRFCEGMSLEQAVAFQRALKESRRVAWGRKEVEGEEGKREGEREKERGAGEDKVEEIEEVEDYVGGLEMELEVKLAAGSLDAFESTTHLNDKVTAEKQGGAKGEEEGYEMVDDSDPEDDLPSLPSIFSPSKPSTRSCESSSHSPLRPRQPAARRSVSPTSLSTSSSRLSHSSNLTSTPFNTSTTSIRKEGQSQKKKTRLAPISPLGTPVKPRFPRYSPGRLGRAVQRFSLSHSLARGGELDAAFSEKEERTAAGAIRNEGGEEDGVKQGDEVERGLGAGGQGGEGGGEETQWESYWSYPSPPSHSRDLDPQLPQQPVQPLDVDQRGKDPDSGVSEAEAEERRKQVRQAELLKRLLAGTPRTQGGSHWPGEGEDREGDEHGMLSDSDEEGERGRGGMELELELEA